MDDSSAFTTRRVGTTGHEILAPNGTVVAWTVDGYWAAVMEAALNEAASGCPPASRTSAPNLPEPCADEDLEVVARHAIEYLADHSLSLTWTFPDDVPPTQAVRSLVATYLTDATITATVSDMVTRYSLRQIANDHLGISGIAERPSP